MTGYVYRIVTGYRTYDVGETEIERKLGKENKRDYVISETSIVRVNASVTSVVHETDFWTLLRLEIFINRLYIRNETTTNHISVGQQWGQLCSIRPATQSLPNQSHLVPVEQLRRPSSS